MTNQFCFHEPKLAEGCQASNYIASVSSCRTTLNLSIPCASCMWLRFCNVLVSCLVLFVAHASASASARHNVSFRQPAQRHHTLTYYCLHTFAWHDCSSFLCCCWASTHAHSQYFVCLDLVCLCLLHSSGVVSRTFVRGSRERRQRIRKHRADWYRSQCMQSQYQCCFSTQHADLHRKRHVANWDINLSNPAKS